MKALFRLLALVPAALAAQQSRDTVVLDPVVVTATRIPTPASAVPALGRAARPHGRRAPPLPAWENAQPAIAR